MHTPSRAVSVLLLAGLASTSLVAQLDLPGTVSTDSSERYAWSANTGWIDFAAGSMGAFRFEDYFLSGFAWSPNLGWIHFGDGVPANGIRYSNRSADDCGVNHDGQGNLSGFAYGANVGWINFQWASAIDKDRARVDLQTGQFFGYAYGANIGWISLAGVKTESMGMRDSDFDGLSDSWEEEFLGGLTLTDGVGNLDGDALTDREEFIADTSLTDSSAFFGILSVVYESDLSGATVTFQSSPRRFYRLEVADSLEASAWTDSGLGLILPSSGNSTTRSVHWTGATRKFIRVAATLPLSGDSAGPAGSP